MELSPAIFTGLFLALWSFLCAMIEVTIEGPVGWALAQPTWRKKSRLYGALMGGKELTGYHLWMFVLPLFLLHMPFVFVRHWGENLWTPAREFEILAYYFLMCAHWDFTWFVLNPHFTLKRFRRGQIWWHQKWVGPVPTDYIAATVLALVLTAAAYAFGEEAIVWLRLAAVASMLGLWLLGIIALAPRFHTSYLQQCWREVLAREDWDRYLTLDEVTRLLRLLRRLEETREEVADLGRIRAEREQLGIKPPATARTNDTGLN